MATEDVLERALHYLSMSWTDKGFDRVALVQDMYDKIRALEARIAELERMVVWMVFNFSHSTPGQFGRLEIHYVAPDDYPESRTCDGTDADILRAVREAMGNGE